MRFYQRTGSGSAVSFGWPTAILIAPFLLLAYALIFALLGLEAIARFGVWLVRELRA